MSSAYNPRCSQQCSRLPQLGISRRSRAQSSRQTSWNRSAKRALASPPFVAARPPATCAPIETAACDEQAGRETRVPMDSSSTAVAHRATSDLHQRPGGTPARALVPNAFVPSGGAIGVDHAAAACLAARSELARRGPFCTWLAIHALAARLPRATGSRSGMNSGTTQRADELAATDPVNRARLDRRLELVARSRPLK